MTDELRRTLHRLSLIARSIPILAALLVAFHPARSVAQIGIGGEMSRSGSDRPMSAPREGRGDRHMDAVGVGVGIGAAILGNALQQRNREETQTKSGDQPKRGKDERTSKRTKGGEDKPKKGEKEKEKEPPPTPPPPFDTLFVNLLRANCNDCDDFLKLIYARQVQIAEDRAKLKQVEATIANLQAKLKSDQDSLTKVADAKAGTYYNDAIKRNVDQIKFEEAQRAVLIQNIKDEQKSLESLMDEFKDCVKRRCPGWTMGRDPSSIIQITDGGKQQGLEDIDCHGHKGRLTVRTGVKTQWDSVANPGEKKSQQNAISISYSGTKCDECSLVQFMWTEVVVTKNSVKTWKKGVDLSTAGKKPFTDDPAHPKYAVDGSSSVNPSYEGKTQNAAGDWTIGGTYNADGQTYTIFDQPTPGSLVPDGAAPATLEDERNDPEVTRIEWKDHFDAFLVCNGKICGKVHWDSTYVWDRNGDDYKFKGPEYSNIGTSTTARPNADQYKALIDKVGPK